MVLGFACIGTTAILRGKRLGLRWEDVVICGAFAVGFGLFCGNILYLAVTYTPKELLNLLARGKYQIFQEGFVFYGGLIGGGLGAFLGAGTARCSGVAILEAALPAVPFAHGIGRIGCMLAGCCHGMPYSGPMAVPDALTGVTYFPVPLLEAVVNCLIGFYLVHLSKNGKRVNEMLWVYLISYSVARFLLEFLRGDSIRGALLGLSTSQWISAAIFFLCLLQLIIRKKA